MQVEEGQAAIKEPHDLEDWASMKRLGWNDDTVQKDNTTLVSTRASSANGELTY